MAGYPTRLVRGPGRRRPMAVKFKQDSIKEWLEATQDKSTISDVTWHGCSGGTISELIYYADTSAFYDKYKEEIFERLNNMAQDMDCESILHLIVTFNGAKEVGSHLQLKNLLAWWAAEDVCREICMNWDTEERFSA